MSIRQMEMVWRHSPLRGEQRLVHLALADMMGHDGQGFASWEQLQDRTKCGRSTVYRALRWMRENGWLEITTAARRGRATHYRLLWPGLSTGGWGVTDETPTDPNEVPERHPNSPQWGVREHPMGFHPDTPSVLDLRKTPSTSLRSPTAGCDCEPEAKSTADHLAALIAANRSTRPHVDCHWHTQLTQLANTRTWEQIRAVATWAHTDPFWRHIITNPAALAQHYDALRLATRPQSHTVSKTLTSLELAAQMERTEHAALRSAEAAHPSLTAGPDHAAR